MLTAINSITRHFFNGKDLEHTSVEELKEFISTHPYSSSVHILLAKKLNKSENESPITASLYLNNPLLLDLILEDLPVITEKTEIKEEIKAEPEIQAQPQPIEEPLTFQSYHTIDYFASQGIRLQQADLSKDKLGQQLKSFTDWLKSMKKLPTSETPAVEDTSVTKNAATSIEEKEVLTESMAEVWLKQGNRVRAIDIYHKLSLQNPDKSAYFAAKIAHLK